MPRSADLSSLFGVNVPITFLLIGACVAVSVVGFWAMRQDRYRPFFVFVPSRLPKGEAWVGALLSHFAHGDVGHLLLNMLALFFFGPRVEDALGALPFLLVYAASGLFGTFAIWLFRRKNEKYSALGASGAVAGVVFASVVILPTSRIFLLIFPVPVPAPIFAVLYLVFSSIKMGGRDGVAHEAHVGGALAGFALAALLFDQHLDPLLRTVQGLVGG